MLNAGEHSLRLVGTDALFRTVRKAMMLACLVLISALSATRFDWGGGVFVKLEYSGPDTYNVRVLRIGLRAPYDMSGTDKAYGATSWSFQCFCGPA
eukprot:1498602-Rhodomonas_salina.2